MFPDLHKHAKKAGQPPGTAIYTGQNKSTTTRITAITYNAETFHEVTGNQLDQLLPASIPESTLTWIHIEGLNNKALMEQLTQRYSLHPLTTEDILNLEQRPKVEEFDHYLYITLKMLLWNANHATFSVEQLSIILGKNFVLSFEDKETGIFNNIYERLRAGPQQRLRQKTSDYLAYRLLDTIVDQYFVVLENLGDQTEQLEEKIIAEPTPENSRLLYHLKRQMLMLRKIVWPMREIVGHLLQTEEKFITAFTRLYIRDLYDHTIQAIETLETFRDMLSNILDVYLSSSTNRMNEVMKVLTIIATIFIPITFIASVFGMNFKYMPGLAWHWGYYTSLGIMLLIGVFMLLYFYRKRWL